MLTRWRRLRARYPTAPPLVMAWLFWHHDDELGDTERRDGCAMCATPGVECVVHLAHDAYSRPSDGPYGDEAPFSGISGRSGRQIEAQGREHWVAER